MFAAMVEGRRRDGRIRGEHDHDIDYVVAEKGHRTGGTDVSRGDDTTYNNLRHGVRVLVLTEGERG